MKRLWTRDMGVLVSYPLLAGKLVFVSVANSFSQGYGSVFYALDQSTGATVWSHPIAGTYFTSLAAYDGDAVYVVNFDGVLTAFAAPTGKTLWQVQLPFEYEFSSPPTATGGVIYINAAGIGATVYAVRESDGSVIWSQFTDGSSFSAPTVSADGIFVSYPCQGYLLDRKTGAIRWNAGGGCDGGGGVTTAYYSQRLFTSGLLENSLLDGNVLVAYDGRFIRDLGDLDSPAAARRWVGDSYPPAVQSDMAYFIATNGLVARSLPSLKVKWNFGGGRSLSPAPIVVNGHVIVASSTGRLYVLNGATGALEQTLFLPASDSLLQHGVPNGLSAGNGFIVVPYLQGLTSYVGSP